MSLRTYTDIVSLTHTHTCTYVNIVHTLYTYIYLGGGSGETGDNSFIIKHLSKQLKMNGNKETQPLFNLGKSVCVSINLEK